MFLKIKNKNELNNIKVPKIPCSDKNSKYT